jgi:hypothetical protein
MKKHQLLEKAMRDYPADTVARFASAPDVDHVSDGTFKIEEDMDNGLCVLSGDGVHCFYSSIDARTNENNPEWAIPVKPSILDGKVAIQVNNEREFKLLMEHYDSKGWKSLAGESPLMTGYISAPFSWKYEDNFGHGSPDFRKSEGCKVLDFADFAHEVGIKVPVKIMVSEDGVDLYAGDDYYRVDHQSGRWILFGDCMGISNRHKCVSNSKTIKAFSTREAAKRWVEEQNKPKWIDVKLFEGSIATVNIEGYTSIKYPHGMFNIKHSDIEEIQRAIKQLNRYKTPSK